MIPACRLLAAVPVRPLMSAKFASSIHLPQDLVAVTTPRQKVNHFSRKHGEGFFRWVHFSCSHESRYKVSLQGIIIIKVIARSHCKESVQGVIARSHCKESLQGVIARSHCKESLQGVMARSHCKESCKESLQGVIARSHCKESLQGVIARSHCKESSASCKCKESSAIDLRGVKISS